MFRCERETSLFGIQKRTQLEISGSVIFTTLFQNTSTQILCVQRILRRTEPGRVTSASDSFKYVSIFKEYATDDSDVSFEQCKVVLVLYRLSQMQTFIHAFSRRFYPKRLTVHSGYTFFCQYMCSLGIEPTTFALLAQCSNH